MGVAVIVMIALVGAGAAFFIWKKGESDARDFQLQQKISEMEYEEKRRLWQLKDRAEKIADIEADQYMTPLEKSCAKGRISSKTDACQLCDGKAIEFTKRGIAVACECCRGRGKH